MISPRVWRSLALAGMLSATLGAATAGAQTVVVRGLAPGSAAELLQEGAPPVTGAANDAGDAILKGALMDATDMRVNLYLDVCANVRRVVIVNRDALPPALQTGCERTPMAGVFVIRDISTVVVNLSAAQPTVLLRQGPYDLRPAREWARQVPAGLVVFGGGGFSRLHNARGLACGTVNACPGDDTGAAYTGGVTFWVTPHIGIEASYLKPAKATTQGEVATATFTSEVDTHVLLLVGKAGVPIGPVRLYGQGGATYHRATIGSVQKWADVEDRFQLTTTGWGWTFGGGLEAWVAPAVAVYTEAGRGVLKGSGLETGGEGRFDDRVTYIVVGLRVSVKR